MAAKPTLHRTAFYFLFTAFTSLTISSCHKDKNLDPQPADVTLKVSTADYNWGELSINKKIESDSVQYDATGKIKRVVTYDNNNNLLRDVAFTYSGSKITLNSQFNDEYDLDNQGRVIYHSSSQVESGNSIVDIDRYSYDANGYLKLITMSFTFNGQQSPVIENIDYTVVNGNYTRFALLDLNGNQVTRQYDFTYDMSKKVKSPSALFSPTFANESYSNIDKYLDYGKSSANLLTGLSYSILNEDNTFSKGSLDAVTTINSEGYITSLNLEGNTIAGAPTDNLSPLPRELSFTLTNQ